MRPLEGIAHGPLADASVLERFFGDRNKIEIADLVEAGLLEDPPP